MTLEDFFTLTEMKDGLTAPARVKELVTVMQKEKDCVVKNVSDTARQWSTVASTIAATENKDCLELFIQLGGLSFIDRWLNDAQKFGNNTGDSLVEESITALLLALEMLHIDNQMSVSSGIWTTVNNLLCHNSSRVQDRARALFDSWKQNRDHDAAPQVVQKIEAFRDDGLNARVNRAGESLECSTHDTSPSRGKGSEEKNIESARDEMMPSMCSDARQLERVDDVQIQTSDKTLDHAIMEDHGLSDPMGSSDMLQPVDENLRMKDEPPTYHSEGTIVIGTFGSAAPKQRTLEGQLDVAELNKYAEDAKQMHKISSSDKVAVMEISSVPSPLENIGLSSSAEAANALESAVEPDSKKEINVADKVPCPKVSPFADVTTIVPEGKSGMDDGESPNYCRSTVMFKNTDKGGECSTDILQDSSGNEHTLEESGDPKSSFPTIEDIGAVDEAREHSSDEAEDDLENDLDFFRPAADANDRDVIDKKSDIELEYGIVDPLEVARQVAIEVEREVVDSREPSCCSSEKIQGGGIGQSDSPDSTNGKRSEPIDGPPKEVPTGLNLSAEDSPMGEEPFINPENVGAERENCVHDMESSRVAVAAQEPEANADEGFFGFDLNAELSSEDVDGLVNTMSSPISVVSASRAAAATGLPVAPLQFEGTLGWKGSAATSAFRPASPRRITEGDKLLFTLGSRNSSKQRLDCLDFDLNVADGGDDKMPDLTPEKQILTSSGLPSGESSVEASPRKSERLQLDLNRVSDGGDVPSDWRREGRVMLPRNGLHSPSPSSSSSSMQPSLRNIDLNDQPSFFNDSSDHLYFGKSSQNLNACGELKPDDSIISIMGARVEVNQKDCVPQILNLPNGRITEPGVDIDLARTGSVLGMGSALPYAQSSLYGYNGLTLGHTMPYSSAMYGPGGSIPYMVDSRGAPVVPQIVGSASALLPAFSQPPSPFIRSMTGAPSGSNGAGPSRHNFDLNSGLMVEGENRDTGVLRQLSNPGRSVDEHMWTNSQPSSSSGAGGKRKEPDSGWELFPFN